MARWVRGGVGVWCLVASCTLVSPPSTPPGRGVPRIANLRVDPSSISVGEPTLLRFSYEDDDADLEAAYLSTSEIREFRYAWELSPRIISLKEYRGQGVGTVEIPLRWETVGIRICEVYLIDARGHVSNRLSIAVTVR